MCWGGLSPFSISQILLAAAPLAQAQAAQSAERQLAANSPSLPPWLCLPSARIVFPFWVFRALIAAESGVGGWQHHAVCREEGKGGAGEPRCGWKRCSLGPFEEERKFSALELPGVEQLGVGCVCPLLLSGSCDCPVDI